ncbi:hypothetical protein BDW62DRAFT_160433 [Aspergillus aurantiobrunneus]
MSFTSILHDEKTVYSVMQEAVETAGAGQENHPENPHDSYSREKSRFSHAIHKIPKRTLKPGDKTSADKNHRKGGSALNKALKSPVKDWKYEKASIAASSVFSAVTLVALILLGVVIVKKYRKRQREKKQGHRNSLDERRRRRESIMFSKTSSSGSYMVEEQKDGKIVRVFCTNTNRPRAATVGASPRNTNSVALGKKEEAPSPLKGLDDYDEGRSGSISRQIVVVSSPLRAVVSRTAVTDSQLAEPSAPTEPTVPFTPAPSPAVVYPELEQDTEAEISSRQSYRRSFFRLPSIRQSISPLWEF